MEEKNMTLLLLGAIALPAIIGMIMMFKGDTTGAGFVSHYEYPTSGMYGAYSNTEQFPYYSPSFQQAFESPGYQMRTTEVHDWAWNRQPQQTYGAKMGRCAILATPEIGQVPCGYTMDANWQQAHYQYGINNCIKEQNSQSGWCCKPVNKY